MMKKNQKTTVAGIAAVTVVLAVLVFATTGKEAPPPGNTDDESVNESAEAHHERIDAVKLSAQQVAAAGIAVRTAGTARIATLLTLPGEIRFNQDRTARIVPRVDGIAESVPAELGQRVKKGQILAVLASTYVSELRSEAMAARKRFALARITYEREKKLWEDRISAEQDYLQARQALQEAEISAENAEQKLLAVGAGTGTAGNFNRYELRAPFDGTVVERHLSPGESIRPDAPVMTLSDLSSVWAEIAVSAVDLDRIRVGTPVTVKAVAFESQTVGKVSYVGALLGEQTRTATARVTLPNPARTWRPGMFANVEIVSGEAEVPVAVDAEAIQTVENETVVFVRTPEGFKAVPVETGRTDGKRIEIRKGIEAGVQYAAQGSFVLKSELGKASAEHEH